jgi:hypothetical protein
MLPVRGGTIPLIGPISQPVPVIGQASLARGEVLWGFFR